MTMRSIALIMMLIPLLSGYGNLMGLRRHQTAPSARAPFAKKPFLRHPSG